MDALRHLMRSCAVLSLVMLGLPAGASATDPPVITGGPFVAGVARVSERLSASATWTADTDVPLTVKWAWQRCAKPTTSCTSIAGATGSTYIVQAADVGFYLRVRLTLTN